MSKSNLISPIKNLIENEFKEKFVLFCGAGISKSSGLPLANELKTFILKNLSYNELDIQKEVDEIIRSKLPFESFMESILTTTNNFDILDVFRFAKPNTNHKLIAKLAKIGYLNIIVTANFDLLIEEAFKQEKLKRNEHYFVHFRGKHFSKKAFENYDLNKIHLFKIHGSIEDKDSIKTTLSAVANKSNSEDISFLMNYLLSTGNHKNILVLGYSFNDIFDINPLIKKKYNRHYID